MGTLWAPWRMEYIEKCDEPAGCIFCEKPSQSRDSENLIVYRAGTAFVILNRFPYNNGHLMIVPFRHTSELAMLQERECSEIFRLIVLSQEVLRHVMKPHGFNIGMNVGRVAGAGIVGHLHFHVVPRWDGDTNFMPILGHAKVLSEALEQTYAKLKAGFDRYGRSP
ncbi:HIT domain-containing protein [bacterium]|nr:HIT domain-containing protein [bacterium]